MDAKIDESDLKTSVNSTAVYQMKSPGTDGKSMLCVKEPRAIQSMFKEGLLPVNYVDESGEEFGYYFIAQMEKPFTGEVLLETFECRSDKEAEETKQHLLRQGWIETDGIKACLSNPNTQWGNT